MEEALPVLALRFERRRGPRVETGECLACDIGYDAVVTARTEWHLVVRCPCCGRAWLIDKARHG